MLQITYSQERDRKLVWEIGARVLEAIGSAFGKHQKYSEMPEILTNKDMEERERLQFHQFVHYFKNVKGKNGK